MVTLPGILLLVAFSAQADALRVGPAPTAVLVDGRLDEHAWVGAEALPFAGVGAELRATHDGESLFLGIRTRRVDEVTGVQLWVGPSGATPMPVSFPVSWNAIGDFTGGEYLSTVRDDECCLEVRVYLGALGLGAAEGAGIVLLAAAQTPTGAHSLVGRRADEPVPLALDGVDLARFRLRASVEGLPASASVGPAEAVVHVVNRSAADARGTARLARAEAPFEGSSGHEAEVSLRFLLAGPARDGLSVDLLGEDGLLLHRSVPVSVAVEPLVKVRTVVPGYRATVYGSQPLDEGLFGVWVTTPEGTPEVDLTGALLNVRTGESLGEQTLENAPPGYYELSFAVGESAQGLYRFVATVRDGDTVLDRATSPLRVLAHRPPEVILDGLGRLLLAGQPAFVIGAVGDAARNLGAASDLGFGLVLDTSPAGATDTRLDATEGLALAGLVPPSDSASVERLSLSPRLAVWWLDPATPEAYTSLANSDPFHPVVVATALDAPRQPDWQTARTAGDVMLVPVGGGGIADEAFGVRALLNADEWRRPVWGRVLGARGRPLPETTARVYACGIAGARGIVFDPGDGGISELADALGPLLRELAFLADVLRAPIARVVPSSSDGRIVAGVRRMGDTVYIIVVNTSGEEVTAELSDLSIVSATNVFEEREMTITGEGAFTETYAPYAARLYRAVPR